MHDLIALNNVKVSMPAFIYSGFAGGSLTFRPISKVNLTMLYIVLLDLLYTGLIFVTYYKFFLFDNLSDIKYLFRGFSIFAPKELKMNFVQLKFVGLGFRIKRFSKNIFKLFFLKPNYMYLIVPNCALIVVPNLGLYAKVKKLILSTSKSFITNCLVYDILLLKKLNPYRIYGILNFKRLVILRSGKQR